MKKVFYHFDKSFICSLIFWGALFLLDTVTSNAQDTTSNSLISTTGTSVLGKGKLMLSTGIGFSNSHYYWSQPYGHRIHPVLAAEGGVRLGIGHQFELSLAIHGKSNFVQNRRTTELQYYYSSVVPSLGCRFMFFEGKKWLPQITFGSAIELRKAGNDFYYFRSTMCLQFRNQIGNHWLLDYSVGINWSPYTRPDLSEFESHPINYSVLASWLPVEKLMCGIGVENDFFKIETRWQATNKLQLSLCGGYYSNIGIPGDIEKLFIMDYYYMFDETFCKTISVQFGLHWLL